MRNLFFLTLSEAVISASQLKDVLGELSSHLRGTLRILVCSVQPKVEFFQHFVDTGAVFEDENLLECGHLERRYAIFLSLLRVNHGLAK